MLFVSGVVDRISNGLAVILVGDISREFHVDQGNLNEGDWLDLHIANNEIIYMAKNEAETQKRKQITHEKKEKLRRRMHSSYRK